MATRVAFDGAFLRLYDDDVEMVCGHVDLVQQAYLATPDSAVFGSDEDFIVLRVADDAWIIPDSALGYDLLVEMLSRVLSPRGRFHRVTTPPVPWRWRRRLLRLIPLFAWVAPGIHPASTVPSGWPNVPDNPTSGAASTEIDRNV